MLRASDQAGNGSRRVPQKLPESSDASLEQFRKGLDQPAVAEEPTRMALIGTNSRVPGDPIAFANDAFLALTGFSSAEILGKPVTVILGRVTDVNTVSSIQKAMADGRDGNWKMPCRHADKSTFTAAIFLSSFRDEDKIVQQHMLSFFELGDNADRAFQQPQSLHALYEKAPGFIATTEGPEHIFTFANESYKDFVGRELLLGLTVSEALPEIVGQGIINILDEVIRTGEPFLGSSMPIDILNPDTNLSETRYIDFVYQPVRAASGKITGIFCEGYDVTAKHKANDAIAALQSQMIHVSRVNAMGMMATTLAHELNQPLSAIANYIAGVRMVDPTAQDVGRFVEALQGIEEVSRRAARIIQNLREFTRQREPARTAFDLKSAVDECVRLVRASTSPEVRFVVQIQDGIKMTADRVQIQQVIINLLVNACDAMQESDRRVVAISASEEGASLVVSVVDTGPGVTVEAAETIFSWSDSSKIEGMGLGLSICRTILEMHRGRIWLEKSNSDGSEFCFSVPLPSKLLPADNK